MKKAYPIVLTQGKDFMIVYVPDFEINTQGQDIPDAIAMARDAIGVIGIDMEDSGDALPVPSTLEKIQKKYATDGMVTLVDVDFAEYRRQNDLRTVKKNCTIPSWLQYEAEKAGVNFSAVLQAGLKRELHIAE